MKFCVQILCPAIKLRQNTLQVKYCFFFPNSSWSDTAEAKHVVMVSGQVTIVFGIALFITTDKFKGEKRLNVT